MTDPAPSSAVPLSSEDARLLAELGFLGVSRGMAREADAVFKALALARPGGEAAAIGRALVLMGAGDARAAAAILRNAPPTDAVAAFTALALARAGEREDAAERLEDVADGSGPVAEMAREALRDVDGGH